MQKDVIQAASWYRKAADQGNAVAQSVLGAMYESGTGVPENDIEGVKWTRKSADQGYAKAQDTLAMMYYLGTGVPQDNVKSYTWWSIAQINGYGKPKAYVRKLRKTMTSDQIAKAEKLAAKCYESDYKDCD